MERINKKTPEVPETNDLPVEYDRDVNDTYDSDDDGIILRTISRDELDEIVREHGLWIEDRSKGKRADLSFTKLDNMNLNRVNLSLANMEGVSLREADLTDANLYEVDMLGAQCCGAIFCGADLTFAELQGASFIGANCSYAKFNGANMVDANLIMANFTSSHIIGANLDGAVLTGTNFYKVVLDNSNLSNVNFGDTELKCASLSGISLTLEPEDWSIIADTSFGSYLLGHAISIIMNSDTSHDPKIIEACESDAVKYLLPIYNKYKK